LSAYLFDLPDRRGRADAEPIFGSTELILEMTSLMTVVPYDELFEGRHNLFIDRHTIASPGFN